MWKLHILALLIGTIIDFIVGDPHWIWHPIKVIGNAISKCEGFLLRDSNYYDKNNLSKNRANKAAFKEEKMLSATQKRRRGLALVFIISGCTFLIMLVLTSLCYWINPYLGVAFEAIASCYCLAGKSLYKESKKVVEDYRVGGIKDARYALSMIVGRDTEQLDLEEVLKATIETISENSSD